jgi:peptide/nickel transport system permease protein
MQQYIFKRLLLAIPTLIGVSMIVFFMLRVLPGDLVQQVAGDNQVTPELRASIEKDLGLDKPAHEEYVSWMGGIAKLDFGNSLRDKSSIRDRLKDALPTTMEMAILALMISLLIALPIGITSAIRQTLSLIISGGVCPSVSSPVRPSGWGR